MDMDMDIDTDIDMDKDKDMDKDMDTDIGIDLDKDIHRDMEIETDAWHGHTLLTVPKFVSLSVIVIRTKKISIYNMPLDPHEKICM
jgi:hypothetical protein